MVDVLVWYALGGGILYALWMTVTAGRRYDLRRPRFVVWSGPGMVLQGATVTVLLGRFRRFLPTVVLLLSALRTVRIERERGEQHPFVSTLQLWPLELAVVLAVGGIEFLLTSWLGLATAPLV